MHPGFVNSNFGNNNKNFYRGIVNILKNLFAISSETASRSPYHLALSDELKNVDGKYFYKLQKKKSCDESYNNNLAEEVWNKSIEYIS